MLWYYLNYFRRGVIYLDGTLTYLGKVAERGASFLGLGCRVSFYIRGLLFCKIYGLATVIKALAVTYYFCLFVKFMV